MTEPITDVDREWAAQQVQEYKALHPRYVLYASTLQALLEQIARNLTAESLVHTRPKAVASFAEKIWRKRDKCSDPVRDFTDLAGGRIITMTQGEVRAVSAFIEGHFEIDWENSIDVGQRLKPTEFGYRSVHYIVQIKPGSFPTEEIPVDIPEEILGLKAEIQVRSLLEHVWADFSHQEVYKKDYTVPDKWKREFAALAAVLEESDAHLSRIRDGLSLYTSRFGPYREKDQILQQIAILTEVLRYDSDNAELADEIGRLCITLGDWDHAIATLDPFESGGNPPVLRDLGTALTKKFPPGSPEFQRGQHLLEIAVARLSRDAEAITTLAETWRGINEEHARRLSEKAFDADPTNPFALSKYLDYVIEDREDLTAVWMLQPTILASIRRSRELAAVKLDLPWPYYSIGKFLLLLGDPYGSLIAFAQAVNLTPHAWMIHTQLRSLKMLARVRAQVEGFGWVESLLLLALASRFDDGWALAELEERRSPAGGPVSPLVIIAGGTDATVEERIEEYRELLIKGFEGFSGTIVSGGTHAGISALVGDIQCAYGDAIRTVGYLPSFIRSNERRDERYSEFRMTCGTGFSPLEPVQYWIDIVAAGIDPSSVKLLGINGGKISAIEYRIALALGAEVGIVQASGRAASRLLVDEEWCHHRRLVPLPSDPATLKTFYASAAQLDPDVRLCLGMLIHEEYLTAQAGVAKSKEPNLRDWDSLPDVLRESNMQQADHMLEKLNAIGYTTLPAKDGERGIVSFTDDEVERLAEMEHGRWNTERLRDGWRLGEKSIERKRSPYLVPWAELPENVREWDRATVRRIPEYLDQIGRRVVRSRSENGSRPPDEGNGDLQ